MNHAPTIDVANFEADTPALDWRPVLEIHRGNPDGFIGFGKKRTTGSGIEHIGAVKVKDAREMIPGLLTQFISYDGYMTVNSYAIAGNPWKKTGLPYLLRAEKYLLELAACYADLDVGRPGEESKHPGASMDWQSAQIEVLRRQREGRIPPFSIMACSGRGVYLFWLLRDEQDPTMLPRAYPSTIIRYKAVNRELHKLLDGLACDQTAADAARFLRNPGSINTKVMKRVTYSLTMQADDGGRLTYSLPELESLLRLNAPAPSLPDDVRAKAKLPAYRRDPYKPAKDKGSRPQYIAQYHRTNELRAQDLETIEAWRGGWLHAGDIYPDGHKSIGRGIMLRLYAGWLRGSGKTREEVLDRLSIMAANCKRANGKPNPYPSDPGDLPLLKIVDDTFSTNPKKHIKNTPNIKLLDWLGISEQTDSELLDRLLSILPESVKALREAAIPKQADLTGERHKAIKAVLDLHRGKIPTPRRMASILADHHVLNHRGKPYSFEIIRQDYAVLGIPSARPGRPHK